MSKTGWVLTTSFLSGEYGKNLAELLTRFLDGGFHFPLTVDLILDGQSEPQPVRVYGFRSDADGCLIWYRAEKAISVQ